MATDESAQFHAMRVMVMRLFQKEHDVLEKAQATLENKNLTKDELRSSFNEITGNYQDLLERLMKITRIGDANQRKLVKSAKKISDHARQLRKTNKEKSEILGVVVHDLRSPTNTIRSNAQHLLDSIGGQIPEESRTDLDTILQTADKMLVLIRDLLESAARDSNRFQQSSQVIAINELVSQTCQNLKALAEEKEIALLTHIPDEAISVKTDANRFWEICVNLISNAIKFTDQGGQVDVYLEQRDGQALLKVCDTGLGIPADQLPKIFDKYTEASRPGTAGESSTGLGLSITKDLVDMHKGRIWVESQEGEGSTFHVSLPLG